MFNKALHDNGLVGFIGVVEDRQDPLMMGRVRVRCFGFHSPNLGELPTSMLPWAQVSMSSGVCGIGQTPSFLVENTWVFGVFLDGSDGQEPYVLGVLPGIAGASNDASKGFNDVRTSFAGFPKQTAYPDKVGEPDVNRLARNDQDHQPGLLGTKQSNRTTGIASADGSWDEPASAYDAQYPFNHVTETESGHAIELDDTPGAERLHFWHKSGSYEEIGPSGARVVKTQGNLFDIATGTRKEHSVGATSLSAAGGWSVKVGGAKIAIDSSGNINIETPGIITINGSQVNIN